MNTTNPKQLLVSAIKNGTVIDHIAAGSALKIIRLLNLAAHNKIVTVGLNLPSKAMGYKDIIKVEDRIITDEEINRIAILAPHASINIIKNYQVDKKITVKLPKVIDYVVVCPNLKCITNHEEISTKFKVIEDHDHLKLQCHYCEKMYKQEEIIEYKNN
jgi:aspartate carbamoyltransferase regulatory subunit